jgi:hypothetical protein
MRLIRTIWLQTLTQWAVCFSLILPYLGICRNIPILDSADPQFSWMDELIDHDFAKVARHISLEDYQQALEIHKKNEWIVRFRINSNQVEGPQCACRNMLEYLCNTYGLPNLDFLYWNQDGSWESIEGKVPVLMGARSVGASNTLLFCDWLFDINNLQAGWHAEQQIIDQLYTTIQWKDRQNKLFWRGAGTDIWSAGKYSVDNWAEHARGKPCYLSTIYPEYIDAAFTLFHHFLCINESHEEKEKLKQAVPFSQHISLEDHLKFKYQLQVSGLMASFPRDRWQFYSESVVFRAPHPHEMYWYSLIRPWEHYIPVDTSMNDLMYKIKWARKNDEECRLMAKIARTFAQTHFMPEHIALYSYKVLLKYSQIQKFRDF